MDLRTHSRLSWRLPEPSEWLGVKKEKKTALLEAILVLQ
jgi:hypothetical protein